MKLQTYLVVNENSIVAQCETMTDACDFIRNVVIRHCVSEIPHVVQRLNGVDGLKDLTSGDEIISNLKDVLPHYTIRRVTLDSYETGDTSCD